MKRKTIITILIVSILISIYIPSSYAVGATVSASKTSAKPGDSVEVYVDLSVGSIGYDLNVTLNDEALISSAERTQSISEMDTNKTNKIALIQVTSTENRVIHPVGTRIATIKYKIADNVAVGSNLIVNVKGNVAGASSTERNTMDEKVTISIAGNETGGQQTNGGDVNNQTQSGNNTQIDSSSQNNNTQENGRIDSNTKENSKNVQENNTYDNSNQIDENIEIAQNKDNGLKNNSADSTIAKTILPNAGGTKIIIGIVILIVTIGVITIIKLKKKGKTKKS